MIGLTAYREHASWGVWHTQAALLPHNYVDLLTQAGGIPVVLPLSSDEAAVEIVAALDGLVLTGGPDIEPVRYGAAPDPYAERFQSDRDTWESALLAEALRIDLPVFGICRGMQLINVHCGGTLVQHLPELAGGQRHRPAPGVFGTVRVKLDTASMPGALLGPTVDVPCYHHQAVDVLGEGLKATAWAADETVEALWNPDHRFLLGVQWHPEVRDDPALFAALVRAAAGGTEAAAASGPVRRGEPDDGDPGHEPARRADGPAGENLERSGP